MDSDMTEDPIAPMRHACRLLTGTRRAGMLARGGRSMQLFVDERQLAHAPKQYMVTGRIVAPLEVPERAATMRDALVAAGLTAASVADFWG
jgi:hypothetical protein